MFKSMILEKVNIDYLFNKKNQKQTCCIFAWLDSVTF